jgi:hypothetical protein
MMKRPAMKTNTHDYLKYFGTGMLCLVIACTAACSAKLVRGASPMVRITELSHQDGKADLQLSIRNINGVDMDIRNIDFRLSMKDEKSFAFNGPVAINIVANGTETWSIELPETEASRELLVALENGDIKSLPYVLSGSVSTLADGNLRFEYEGYIYPLPGRPGHFR